MLKKYDFAPDFLVFHSNLKYVFLCPNTNISISSVYGLEAIFAEDTAAKPISYYGITKLTAEQLVLQKSRENKMKACSLRLRKKELKQLRQ